MTSLNRGPFRVQYEKNSPHFNFFTLTPWVAWVTNMSYARDIQKSSLGQCMNLIVQHTCAVWSPFSPQLTLPLLAPLISCGNRNGSYYRRISGINCKLRVSSSRKPNFLYFYSSALTNIFGNRITKLLFWDISQVARFKATPS